MKKIVPIALFAMLLILQSAAPAYSQYPVDQTWQVRDDRYEAAGYKAIQIVWPSSAAPTLPGQFYHPRSFRLNGLKKGVASTVPLPDNGWVWMLTFNGWAYVWQEKGTLFDYDAAGRPLYRHDCGNPAPFIWYIPVPEVVPPLPRATPTPTPPPVVAPPPPTPTPTPCPTCLYRIDIETYASGHAKAFGGKKGLAISLLIGPPLGVALSSPGRRWESFGASVASTLVANRVVNGINPSHDRAKVTVSGPEGTTTYQLKKDGSIPLAGYANARVVWSGDRIYGEGLPPECGQVSARPKRALNITPIPIPLRNAKVISVIPAQPSIRKDENGLRTNPDGTVVHVGPPSRP